MPETPQAESNVESSSKQPTSQPDPVKKEPTQKTAKYTLAACRSCRKKKTKCDGVRPTCAKCQSSTSECKYDVAPNQTRFGATRERNEFLESLFETLKSAPDSRVDALLTQIRGGAVVEDLEELLKNPNLYDGGTSDVATPSITTEYQAPKRRRLSDGPSPTGDPSKHPISQRINSGKAFIRLTVNSVVGKRLMPLLDSQKNAPKSTLLDDKGIDSLTDILEHADMPNAELTRYCVNGFFDCSGKLFHVFDREQAQEAFDAVFNGTEAAKDKVSVCNICAMAAVGSLYLKDEPLLLVAQIGEVFYRLTKTFLEDVIERDPVTGVRIAILLTHYNVLTKQTTALAYCELGFALARRAGLNTSHRSSKYTHQEWYSRRWTWRTLIFFQSWLSVTVGYVSSSWHADYIKDIEIVDEHAFEDIVQMNLAKIGVIKANILYKFGLFREMTLLSLESFMNELRDWYSALPTDMALSSITKPSMSNSLKSTILFAHLLYLGAIMLVYRCIIGHYVRAQGNPPSRDILSIPSSAATQYLAEGLVAAKTTSRILRVLQDEGGIMHHCWVVIFQTYISCAVVLHSIVQKQLHQFPAAEITSDLEHVELCIDILRFCATTDSVAGQFLRTLEPFYKHLQTIRNIPPEEEKPRVSPSPGPSKKENDTAAAMAEAASSEPIASSTFNASDSSDALYLLFIPHNPTDFPLRKMSIDLMHLLSRPFAGGGITSDVIYSQHLSIPPMMPSATVPRLVEHLEVQYEDTLPPADWRNDDDSLPEGVNRMFARGQVGLLEGDGGTGLREWSGRRL